MLWRHVRFDPNGWRLIESLFFHGKRWLCSCAMIVRFPGTFELRICVGGKLLEVSSYSGFCGLSKFVTWYLYLNGCVSRVVQLLVLPSARYCLHNWVPTRPLPLRFLQINFRRPKSLSHFSKAFHSQEIRNLARTSSTVNPVCQNLTISTDDYFSLKE